MAASTPSHSTQTFCTTGTALAPKLMGLSSLGTAGGPLLLGWLHDAAGGYRASYLVAAALSLSGAVVLLFAGPAKAPDPERAEVLV